ncbi:L-threonine 3-dehydrogenase [Coralliovum pocilloporae]|uniref:L-threonine 3-dehydrogenase n=1 Tax=Coralliovum pocilloporae TaxID=3066369 RepID=UPI0033078BF0
MRALVKAKSEEGLWLEEVPLPDPGPDDVLIKVRKVAICGTDVHIYNWDDWAQKTVPVPLVTGHEHVGTVIATGANVRSVELGARVVGEGHIVCGTCRNCRAGREHLCRNTLGVGVNHPGAFADYVVLPAHNLYQIPDEIPDEIAAIFDPLGNAVHTSLSFDLVGEDVLITGAGPIGLMSAAIARHVGARHVVVTDMNDERLRLAEQMGANRAVRADRENLQDVMADLGMREGFDVGLEMSGNSHAFRDMLGAMNHGGRIGFLGIPLEPFAIDWNQVIFKGLVIKGIYGREMFDTWYKMVSMLQSGLDVSPVITHRLPFERFQDGFDALRAGQACKVILDVEA